MIKNVYWSSSKILVILVRFLMKLGFSRQVFAKNTQISTLMKILPVGAELFRADRRTDGHDEANNRLMQFCERAQNQICLTIQNCLL